MSSNGIYMDRLEFEGGCYKTTIHNLPAGYDQAIWSCWYMHRFLWRMQGSIITRDIIIWLAVATEEQAMHVMHWIFEDFVDPKDKLPESRWELEALSTPRSDQRKEA